MRFASTSVLAAVTLLLTGCSSISKSISSPFESSSASFESSSESSGGRAGYREDVADYTQAYVQSGGQIDAFERGLDNIAKKHGVSNWEADEDTYVGIGAGLRRAGVTPEQFAVWKTNLSQGDAQRAAWMQKGYSG
ncbi:MAG: putative lipoprotein [Candidatus Binatia bacterium]